MNLNLVALFLLVAGFSFILFKPQTAKLSVKFWMSIVDHIVRVAGVDDFKRIVEIFDHPKIVPESSQHPYLGYEKISNLFEKSNDNSIVLVGEVDGVVGGYLKIDLNVNPRSKHVASIGMAVHPDFHGRGLG